jgi:nucleolin
MYIYFADAGNVDRIRFATAEDGSFKGFAHVQFSDGASTDEAVKMAGTDINGRAIRVDYAPPRDRQSAGGGASGGTFIVFRLFYRWAVLLYL